jgi:hypothetical protein
MQNFRRAAARLAALLVLGLAAGGVQAQATRTWVSGTGDDVNPCSLTAPCKTFAGAISKTASGGQISVLNPGGYGTLTITKPITVEGFGLGASTLSSSVNAFVINIASPAAGDRVVLRNLQIDGAGTTIGTNGIRVLSGTPVLVENVSIQNLSGAGIDLAPSAAASVVLRNVTISRAATGIRVNAPAVSAQVAATNVQIAQATTGVSVTGPNAVVALSDSSISFTDTAIVTATGGQVQSFGDNRLFGNTNASGPTSEIGEQ